MTGALTILALVSLRTALIALARNTGWKPELTKWTMVTPLASIVPAAATLTIDRVTLRTGRTNWTTPTYLFD